MRAPKHRTSTIAAALALALAFPAAAQDPVDTRQQEVDQAAAKALMAFGRRAENYKAHRRARKVYELVIDHYDAENPVAMRALGYKKVGDEWREEKTLEQLPKDEANERHRRSLDKLWVRTSAAVGKLHSKFGLALLAEGHEARARYQLERAVKFDPSDRAAHEGLGHQRLDGFWGDEAQLAFVRRMRAIHAKADECAQLEVEVEAVDAAQMPEALRVSGLAFAGARSEHFECWIVDSQEDAAAMVVWMERALAMLEFFAADVTVKVQGDLVRYGNRKYVAIVRTKAQREQLVNSSPAVRGTHTLDRLKLIGGTTFEVPGGYAEWMRQPEKYDADAAVGLVTKRYLGIWFNSGMSEGFVHAMTWWLCGSLHSSYMAFAHTTTDSDDDWERDPEQWHTKLGAQIAGDEDWPLVQVPRERMDNFRDPCRAKAWSFVRWLFARHPNQWFQLVTALRVDNLQEDAVREAFEKHLGRSVGEVEAEWREWARDGSPIGRATQR